MGPIGVIEEVGDWLVVDAGLLATARDLAVGIVAWSPLGGGFLTGTVTRLAAGDFRHNAPRFSVENLAANNDRYTPVCAIAAELGITPGQLALAWLLAQYPAVVPIPGNRTPVHVVENAESACITLHPDTLRRVDEALADFDVVGGTLL